MIVIEKGKLTKNEHQGIINYNLDEVTTENIKGASFTEECWILMIPKDKGKIQLLNAHDNTDGFVPINTNDEYYDMFWNTEMTFLFVSEKSAITFMKNHNGPLSSEINEYYDCVMEQIIYRETISRYECMCNLYENVDGKLYKQLEKMMYYSSINLESFLNTMKLFMLESYGNHIELDKMINNMD